MNTQEAKERIKVINNQLEIVKKVLFQNELTGISLTRQFKIKTLISEEIDELNDALMTLERYLESFRLKN